MIRYAGTPNAVCGDNRKMPKEYTTLYSELMSAKVTFPRERKFLDWPIHANRAGDAASDSLESGDEDEPQLNNQIRNNPQRPINPGNRPVNQDQSIVSDLRNMNGGDPLQQFGDLPNRLRDLKVIRTKIGEMVLANPGHPSKLLSIT
jgi:hypothetical protein